MIDLFEASTKRLHEIQQVLETAKLDSKWKNDMEILKKTQKTVQLWESMDRHFKLLTGNKQRMFSELLSLAQIKTRKHRFRVMLVLMLTSTLNRNGLLKLRQSSEHFYSPSSPKCMFCLPHCWFPFSVSHMLLLKCAQT